MKHILCYLLLLFCFTATAEVKVLTPLVDESGESLPDIGKMVQDKYGFLWSSGARHLRRFDGYQFVSVLENTVSNTLFIDSKNRLWTSGLYTLVQIDLSTNHVRIFDTLRNDDFDNNKIEVWDARETIGGTMLFGTGYGLSVFDEKTDRLKHFSVEALVDNEMKRTVVSSIEFLNDTTLLLGTLNGVFRLPLASLLETTESKLALTDNIGSYELIRSITKIDSDQYLFTHNNGFSYMDFSTQRKIRHENKATSKVLSDDLISAVHVLDSERVLIGTNQDLDIFNLNTLEIVSGSEVFRFGELKGQIKVSSIYRSNGVLYIATPNSIYTISLTAGAVDDATQRNIDPVLRRTETAPAGTLNTVWSIGSDEDYGLMIGTHGLGAFSINPNGDWSHYRSNTGELHSDNVSTFHVDDAGSLWVGMVGGVSSNKNEQKELRPIELPQEIPEHGGYSIRTIRQAEDSTIWILSMDWLAQFTPSMDLLQLYDFNAASDISCKNFATTFEHLGEIVLVGCENGLLVIDTKESKVLKRLDTNKLVTRILKDSNSNIWVLSREQLFSFQQEELALDPVQSADFFASISPDGFFNMIEDTNSQVWIAYHGGTLVFDPIEREFLQNFGKQSSFKDQLILFGQDSMHLSKSGDILIGDMAGLFSFTPQKLSPPPTPSVNISRVAKTFKDGSDQDSSSKALDIASLNSSPDGALVFDHTLEKLEFEFTDLDLRSRERAQYQYYLEGAEHKWSKPSEERSVSYLGLKSGNYALHVKSLKNLQYSDELVFPFTISPHPLLSFPAKVLYAVVAVALLLLLSKLRSISLQRRVNMLETHVRERTQELSDKNLDIENLLNEKELMIENVFHQTRTPIQLLIANMDQLKVGDIQIPDYVEKQSVNIQGLIDLTDRVLAGAHKEDAALQHQCIDLILSQHAEKHSLIAKQKGLEFVFSSDKDLYLTTNDVLLGEAIDNLLSNSIKYTESGYVKFSARIESGTLKISVEDSGEGIIKEDVARVLSRGYRAQDNTTKTGNGIGLAIVKENIGYLGGSISIDSEVNQGSTFSLEFLIGDQTENVESEVPVRDNSARETLNSYTSASISDSDAKDVLLVEDNIELAAYYRKVLEKDYRVKLVHSGEEAIQAAIRDVPNIVVSDVMMGEITGFDVVSALRENPVTRHIPLILLTAKADQRSKIQGFNVGANDYIVKPVLPHELSLRVKNQLNLVRYIEKHTRLEELDEDFDYDDEIASKFLELVKSRYAEPELSSEDMASSLNVTRKQLERKVKQVLNSTPKQFLNDVRLSKARIRLSRGEKVSAVFQLCGFSSHAYFSKKFKEKFGYTPSNSPSLDLTQ